jgi:YcaO-like protein with predicted kinase domain
VLLPPVPDVMSHKDGGVAERLTDLGGTLRTCAVEQTLERAKQAFESTGITRLANVTGLDSVGVPVWTAIRPLAKSLSVSQGKGLSHELAQVSAAMEAIELHHAEDRVPAGYRLAVGDVVRSRNSVSLEGLPIRSDARLTDNCEIDWVAAVEIVAGRSRLIPREMVCLNFAEPRADCSLFTASSNGLASGNTLGEAILHALCEVVERDQVSFWRVKRNLGPNPPTRVDLDSIVDPCCRSLIERCQDAGLEVCVWDCGQTLGVPCFTCTVFYGRHATLFPQRASGHGSHPLRRIAMSRAVTEALQSRLTHISGARDDIYFSRFQTHLPVDTPGNIAWIDKVRSEAATCDYACVPEAPDTSRVDLLIDWLLAALSREGLHEVAVVDLTTPEIGVHVAKVVVPGLEFSAHKPYYTPGPRMQRLLDRFRI